LSATPTVASTGTVGRVPTIIRVRRDAIERIILGGVRRELSWWAVPMVGKLSG
jgi:hypothetical protein